MGRINCFIPFVDEKQAAKTIEHLKSLELVNKIYLLATVDKPKPVEGCEMMPINVLFSSATMREIAGHADADYVHKRIKGHAEMTACNSTEKNPSDTERNPFEF